MTSNTNTDITSVENEYLKLDNQLCFALYVCSKEIIRKYKPLLDPLNLTYTSYITLLALWEKDDITVKELGKKLFLDSGTLTPLLKKMENEHYVTRVRSVEDERNVYIRLTEEGKALKEKAAHIPEQMMCSSKFSPEEGAVILKALHEMMLSFHE
ncbi:MAG: MarR family transcriptional regulator [Lachnospiraceae bacterium]|nr:MarR family transcriptional regulator [Lachnospiraceae bacterium]